jgi:membrane peptidoglycan carboxypeptidase
MKNSRRSILETGKSSVDKGKHFIKKKIFQNEPITHKRFLKMAIGWTGTFLIATIFTSLFAITVFSIGLPDLNDAHKVSLSTEILDRNGIPLYSIHGEQNRNYVTYDKISPNIVNATIAIEDSEFWTHSGFDIGGIFKGVIHEFTGLGSRRGGSTITQQYAKNAFLTPERSIIRKIRELILAVKIEHKFDKKKILELYLNQIPYGNNAYGIEKASQVYFGKSASDLTLGESAILAAIPQAPSYYNPYGSHAYSTITKSFSQEELQSRPLSKESDLKEDEYDFGLVGKTNIVDTNHKVYIGGRADLVLKRMVDVGLITEEEKNAAWKQTQQVIFKPFRESIRAPHFVMYVRELLERKYGKEVLENGGLKIYTTLDWKLQDVAEKTITARAEGNEKTYKATDAAALFVDPRNGQILTMVGSRDYFNDEIHGKVNVTQRPRLPGSSFKPIVYAQAFLNRYSPATVIYDTPTKIGVTDSPQNYDGTFQGPMPIRRALPQSRNIPAIKAYYMGGQQGPIIDLAHKMGIATLDSTRDYGYPLAIGAGEVTMQEMVTAFSVFANMGTKPVLNPILKVENSQGEILEEWKEDQTQKFEQVLDPQVAYLIDDILSDPTYKLSQNLSIPGHTVATKTGTSTNKTKSKGNALPMDLWVMGYTPQIVGSVWVGNAKGDPMSSGADGSNVSAPIWKAIMTEALKDKPDEPFAKPEGIKTVSISTGTGLLPSDKTPKDKIKSDIFASFAVPTEVDNTFFSGKVDIRNKLLANDNCPPEFVQDETFQEHKDPIDPFGNWIDGINQWFAGKGEENGGSLPKEESPLCKPEYMQNQPTITLITPPSGSTIGGEAIFIQTNIDAKNGVKKVEYFFDTTPRLVKTSAPFNEGLIKIPRFANSGEIHTIKVKVTDTYDYSSQAVTEIRIAE